MARDLFSDFRWGVSDAGYDWVDAKLALVGSQESGVAMAALADQMQRLPKFTNWTGEPLPEGKAPSQFVEESLKGLIPFLMPRPEEPGVRFYKPLSPDHSGLFRTFAEVQPTREGIRGFADKYGLLGDGAQVPLIPAEYDRDPEATARWLLRLDDSPSARLARYGEPFGAWCNQVLSMRRVVELWDAIRRKDERTLADRIIWQRYPDGKVTVSYCSDPDSPPELLETPFRVFYIIAADDKYPELLQDFRGDDLYGPAWVYIERVLNVNLARRVSPRSKWNHGKDRLPFSLVPTGLLGALWLQFALAVDGNKNYRQCEQCQAWFEVSPKVGRVSKRYCGDTCRIRAHRGRQEKARQLHGQGKSYKAIAQELDTDVKTIKKWVANRKG